MTAEIIFPKREVDGSYFTSIEYISYDTTMQKPWSTTD
jgi:hypothetical protein